MLGRSLDNGSPSTVVSIVIFTDYFARWRVIIHRMICERIKTHLERALIFLKIA